MYSFDIVSNKTQTFVRQHEIIKTLTDIKLPNIDKELFNRDIYNNILKKGNPVIKERNCDFTKQDFKS